METADEKVVNIFANALPSIANSLKVFLNELAIDPDGQNQILMYDFSAQVLMPESFRPLMSTEVEDSETLAALFGAVEELASMSEPRIATFLRVEIFESIMTNLDWYERSWRYMGEQSKALFAKYFEDTRTK